MTEQELIQENEKLKGRLAKAIEVFKEQKENITALTEERDKALADAEFQAAKVQKLEEKLAEKSSNDDKFFEQEEEIGKLNAQIDKDKMELDAACETIDGLKSNLEAKNKEIADLKDVSQKQAENIAARDSKIDELASQVEKTKLCLAQRENELSNARKELDEARIDVKAIEEERDELQKETEEQHERIENLSTALDKAHEALDQERKETKEYWGRVLDKAEELRVMLTNGQG